MLSGFWSNDGMNDDKGTRENAVRELEEQFERAVIVVASGKPPVDEGITEEDTKNPFLAPAIKATREIETPVEEDGTVKQAIDSGPDYESLDQT